MAAHYIRVEGRRSIRDCCNSTHLPAPEESRPRKPLPPHGHCMQLADIAAVVDHLTGDDELVLMLDSGRTL